MVQRAARLRAEQSRLEAELAELAELAQGMDEDDRAELQAALRDAGQAALTSNPNPAARVLCLFQRTLVRCHECMPSLDGTCSIGLIASMCV